MTARFFNRSSSKTKRIITIAIFFAFTIVATCVGAIQTLSQQEATQITDDLNQLRDNITIQYVFGNNLFICLMMFIPVVGWVLGFWVLYNTGVVIAAQGMSVSAHGVPALALFFALFIFPFTWLEFISYSVGLAESFWLTFRVIQSFASKGISFKRELKNASTLITIVTLMLLVAAIIEVVLIMAIGS